MASEGDLGGAPGSSRKLWKSGNCGASVADYWAEGSGFSELRCFSLFSLDLVKILEVMPVREIGRVYIG